MIRFIGDVHGKWDRYKNIIKEVDTSIQVGDMGVGFFKKGIDPVSGLNIKIPTSNPPYNAIMEGNHRCIRGNHDNPQVIAQQKYYIPDGHYENDMMFIGGATSIDKMYRTEGYDWWSDEEVTDWKPIKEKYLDLKPKIMVTHECPEHIVDLWLKVFNKTKFNDLSMTRHVLNELWLAHRPKLWVYGHWHKSFDKVVDGTRFICLAELEYKDIDIQEI